MGHLESTHPLWWMGGEGDTVPGLWVGCGEWTDQRVVGGVGDRFEALEGDVAGGVEGDHVGKDDVGIDVLGVLEVIAGVEGGGDVPPEAVIVGEEPADQGF